MCSYTLCYPDYKKTNLCSYSLMMCAKRKIVTYKFIVLFDLKQNVNSRIYNLDRQSQIEHEKITHGNVLKKKMSSKIVGTNNADNLCCSTWSGPFVDDIISCIYMVIQNCSSYGIFFQRENTVWEITQSWVIAQEILQCQ